MLITKTNPVGIDARIQELQTHIHARLLKAWGLTTTPEKYACYGRAYRNKRGNGYVAEVYMGGDEYKEAYWNDELYALSFFGFTNNIKEGPLAAAEVHLVFFVNLEKLKPNIAHRADEEVRQDVTGLFGYSLFDFSFSGVDLWLENVLREYPGSYRDERLLKVDMHPLHCFRLNLKLNYDLNTIC